MAARSGLDPFGSPDILIDQNIGNAYRNVRLVARYMELVIKLANSFEDGSLIPNIGEPGKDGKDGTNGKDGKDGKDGTIITEAILLSAISKYLIDHPIRDGRDGRDATDAQVATQLLSYFTQHPVKNGTNGVGVVDINIVDNHLMFSMSDGKTIDAGELQRTDLITIFNTLSNSTQISNNVEGFMEAFPLLDTGFSAIKATLLVEKGERLELTRRMDVLEGGVIG